MLLALLIFALPASALLVDGCGNSTFTSTSTDDASSDVNVGDASAPDAVVPDARPVPDAGPIGVFCDGGHTVCDDFDNETKPPWPAPIWQATDLDDLKLVTDQFISPPGSLLVQPSAGSVGGQPVLTYEFATSGMLEGFRCDAEIRVETEPVDGGAANMLVMTVGGAGLDTFSLTISDDTHLGWGVNVESLQSGVDTVSSHSLATVSVGEWAQVTLVINGFGARYSATINGVSFMGIGTQDEPLATGQVQVGITSTNAAWKSRLDNVVCDQL